MNNVSPFYHALKSMVEHTQEVSSKNRKSYISDLAWAKEFATVKLYLPRGSGHTTMVKLLYEDHFNQEALVVVPNDRMISTLYREVRNCHNHNIISSFQLKNMFPLFSFDVVSKYLNSRAIIVDCSYMLSESKTNMVYKLGLEIMSRSNRDFVFIFVQ